jgi:hypothetical protein
MTAKKDRLIIDKIAQKQFTVGFGRWSHKLLKQLPLMAAFCTLFMAVHHEPGKQRDRGKCCQNQGQQVLRIQRDEITAVEDEAKQDVIYEVFHDFTLKYTTNISRKYRCSCVAYFVKAVQSH